MIARKHLVFFFREGTALAVPRGSQNTGVLTPTVIAEPASNIYQTVSNP